MEFQGLPGIEEYFASRAEGCPIEVSELGHITEAIIAYTGLSKEHSERILILFFQEIRSAMLQGKMVDLRKLGSFFISSPRLTSNTIRVFPKFHIKKSLSKRLNQK